MDIENKTDRHVIDVLPVKGGVRFVFNDGEYADFLKFGVDYVITYPSERVLKKTLVNIRQDVITYQCDVEKLKSLWINN